MAKSIYLRDPDGICLELSVETPERGRSMRITANGVEVIDAKGQVRGGSEALDVGALLATLPTAHSEGGMPVGTFIEHVHLSVADLGSARVYRDGLGMLEHLHSGEIGFADLHAGGRFEHRIAVNTWQGAGAPAAPAGSAGLRQFSCGQRGIRPPPRQCRH